MSTVQGDTAFNLKRTIEVFIKKEIRAIRDCFPFIFDKNILRSDFLKLPSFYGLLIFRSL